MNRGAMHGMQVRRCHPAPRTESTAHFSLLPSNADDTLMASTVIHRACSVVDSSCAQSGLSMLGVPELRAGITR
jgi:hypothetical protein